MKSSSQKRISRNLIFQNLFMVTRTYFYIIKTAFSKDDLDDKESKRWKKLSLIVLPIAILLLPILDILLLIFLPGLHLFKPLFKAGWKYGLISAIGVTLAVSVITQYVFFIYSYQFQAFNLFLADEPRTYIQVQVESTFIQASFNQYNSFDRIADIALNYINMSDRVLQRDLFFKRGTFTQTFDPITNETILPTIPLIGTEGKLRTYLVNNIAIGRAPENPFEILAVVSSDYYNHSSIRVNTSMNLYIPIAIVKDASLHVPDAYTTVNVTGIVFFDEISDYNVLGSDVGIPLEYILELDERAAAVTWWIQGAQILQSIAMTYGLATMNEDLFYDVTSIDAFQLEDEINTIKLIGIELKDWYLLMESYTQVRINSYLVDLLESFQNEYNLYQTFMYAFLSPIIALTIILTIYAANLVRKKRDQQLTILTERGTNRLEIGSYLSLESLIIGGVSLFFGVILGIPISALLTRSSGFLSFSNSTIPLQIDLSSVYVALMGSIGAILLIQIFNTLTLLKKRSIDDYGKVEKSLPSYYKYYVDIILIVFGIVIWIIYRMPGLVDYQDLTARSVGIPATILILFGSILFMQRLLPMFSKIIVRISSLLKADIVSLSVREIYRYQKSFARSSIILTLSFSLVVSSIVIPSTYQSYNTEGAYYDLGADIVIRGFPIDNTYLKGAVDELPEVDSSTIVRFVNLRDVQGDLAITYSVLTVNVSEYERTAYYRKDFANKPLGDLLNQLDHPMKVLGQKDELAVLNQDIGESISVTYRAYNESMRAIIGTPFFYENISVSVADKYEYWPVLVKELSLGNARSIFYHFVASIEFMDNVQLAPFDVIDYLFIKGNSSYALADVTEKVLALTGGMVTNVEDEIFVKPDSPRSSILFSAINSTLIMSFAINAIILALFASIQLIDKARELATMKAIGISTNQLLKYYLAVYIVLLLFTTIAGLIVGYITSTLLMGVLTINRSFPPYTMGFPVVQLLISLSALLVTAFIGAAIPTFSSSKEEIGTELRQSA
ncbi:MAG: ABC transporter permease [Candidatus Heimdallarchaeota archaeon]|nr:ABC transporter permease [Candidatus Heimdallarchaeota archaeon]